MNLQKKKKKKKSRSHPTLTHMLLTFYVRRLSGQNTVYAYCCRLPLLHEIKVVILDSKDKVTDACDKFR